MAGHKQPRKMGVPRPPRRRFATRSVRVHTRHLPVVDETSAGGLVVKVENGKPYVAVIARRNRAGKIEWCLPKGHLERGETAETAAMREIAEETGILGQIVSPLASIDYWFSSGDRRVHKVVHHYLLEFVEGDITVENDPDQEAEDAAWFPLAEVSRVLAYPNERRVVAIALDLLYPGK
jgi:8-oxo-dGTP pyrophosphatase MutT (NUDIX family)